MEVKADALTGKEIEGGTPILGYVVIEDFNGAGRVGIRWSELLARVSSEHIADIAEELHAQANSLLSGEVQKYLRALTDTHDC